MTWGGWHVKSITMPAGSTSTTVLFSGPFWGWDDAQFVESGDKTYTYYTGSKNYIEFLKNIEPYTDNAYDLCSDTFSWRTLWLWSSPIIRSDKNLKKDISYDFSKYEILFDQLKPAVYRLKKNGSNRIHTGFIAQDVESAMIESGLSSGDFAAYCESYDNNHNVIHRSLRYEEFIALNTYEIQKLKKRVDELESMLKVNDAS